MSRSKPSQDKERMASIIEDAEQAFWAVVADRYPEAIHGDFAPDQAIAFSTAMEQAVTHWVEANADPVFHIQSFRDNHGNVWYYHHPTGSYYSVSEDNVGGKYIEVCPCTVHGLPDIDDDCDINAGEVEVGDEAVVNFVNDKFGTKFTLTENGYVTDGR